MPTFLDQFLSTTYVGYTGSQGVQGTQGIQGTEGPQGIQGNTGTQGTLGQQGIQGTEGPQGIQGTAGQQGVQGTAGAQGAQGEQGIQGTNGAQGTDGIQGITGSQGIQGITGSQGIQGITGSQGIQGIDGAFVSQGIQGITGSQGIQGIQGSVLNISGLPSANTLIGTEIIQVFQDGEDRKSTADDVAARFGKNDTTLTAGYTTTAADDGTQSSGTYTPTPTGGNMRRIVNGGAFTFAAPTATGDFSLVVQITNNSSAGAVTWSGFTKTPDGDALTTTDTHRFNLFITKLNSTVIATVKALQ
jgi:hypothetical protein